jgi:hypothetical protein
MIYNWNMCIGIVIMDGQKDLGYGSFSGGECIL